jgi:cell division protein FtsL
MNSMDTSYAVNTVVRNNPIAREIDPQQQPYLRRTVLAFLLAVGMLLFSGWQHVQALQHSYQIEALQKQRTDEETLNRQLRLELEMLRAPARIEQIATTQLHMIAPSSKDALVIERVGAARPSPAIVAQLR